MELKAITLLAEKEYQKYKSLIPLIKDNWWLRTPGSLSNTACYIYKTGDFRNAGGIVLNSNVGVRPALKLKFNFSDPVFWHKREKLIGSKIKYGLYNWTVLDVKNGALYVLCDEIIAKHRFDTETNVWQDSELKSWLDAKWMELITK